MTGEAGERGPFGTWGDWAELLRVSALFTVPGDALAGAAAARRGPNRGTALAVCASLCLYEAGMALNDWADRDIDAVERPGRPLPSGRIAPAAALTAATGLTAAGLLCAAAAGGPALATATALAGTVWAYDLGLKNTPAGPPAMAAARALDLLLGATASAGHLRPALRPAALLGAHTLAVTTVSRREATGGSSTAPLGALATGAAIAWSATRRPAPAAGRGPGMGHGAPVAVVNGATSGAPAGAMATGGAPAGGAAAGGAIAALARGLSRTGPRRAGPARLLAGAATAPASPSRGNRPGWRRAARRALAQAGRLPAVGGVSTSGRGSSGGEAVGRTVTGLWSRSAAARHMAATVRADASPKAAASAPAAVQGATAAVARELTRGKGVRAGRGGPARRLVAAVVAGRRVAVAAAAGRGGPPGGPRAGAGLRLTVTSGGAAAGRTRPGGRIAAVAGVGLVGGRAGGALPRNVPSRGAAVSRFAAVAGVALAGGYVATVARPLAHAALNPSPYLLQRAVGSGIRAMIPLQAVLASRAGAHRTAAGLLALMPVARRLSRKVSAT
ncbi:UbiA prenyltransferase [Streptomyces sp. PRh5]|uniref:SCO3242 family prenyltransferase n=1 Tax=Streptomyces sp. PRh5 TaxID=1158056 RepID=UPI00044EA3F7|nr:UbiA family prenyltransferase [Streptomyces sp. PRh5]EXU64903.1 UbiA prenyltransferase [Streptomyces sp. PRh5]